MTDFATAIAEELGVIELSSTSTTRFNNVKDLFALALGINAADVYVAYINSPSNATVRLDRQAGMRDWDVAVGICEDDELESVSYERASRKLLTKITACPGVLLMTKTAGSWAVAQVFERARSTLGRRAQEIWPKAKITTLAGLGPPSEPHGAVAGSAETGTDESDRCDAGALASELLMDSELVRELVQALLVRRQVVLAGPPGTSKTLLAKRLALCVAGGDSARVTLVQFHPSYGYEDFIEGVRPTAREGGGLDFQLVPGHLVSVARRAQADLEGRYHVLIIDEMNRANLPRVFGELMYLFEYRDEPIDLMVTKGFRLPANLLVIATMNTADRSIRSLDTALRRRFEVFELPEDYDLLGAYYATKATNSVPDLVEGLRALNERLGEDLDRHHRVGHAWLMREAMTPEELRAIWMRKIRPLVEEYFFDQPDRVAEYDVEAFWPSLTK